MLQIDARNKSQPDIEIRSDGFFPKAATDENSKMSLALESRIKFSYRW